MRPVRARHPESTESRNDPLPTSGPGGGLSGMARSGNSRRPERAAGRPFQSRRQIDDSTPTVTGEVFGCSGHFRETRETPLSHTHIHKNINKNEAEVFGSATAEHPTEHFCRTLSKRPRLGRKTTRTPEQFRQFSRFWAGNHALWSVRVGVRWSVQ